MVPVIFILYLSIKLCQLVAISPCRTQVAKVAISSPQFGLGTRHRVLARHEVMRCISSARLTNSVQNAFDCDNRANFA
jgi:hypothetical protein